jgi:hypothetical protein
MPHPDISGDTVYDVSEWEPIGFGLGVWNYVERFDKLENAEKYVNELIDICRVVVEHK